MLKNNIFDIHINYKYHIYQYDEAYIAIYDVVFLFNLESYFCYIYSNLILGVLHMIKQTLLQKISLKIKRSRKQVFLRSDFEKLADYDQVGRALRQLVRKGVLIKLGYGLYVKSKINRFTNQPMISAAGGFRQVAYEALKRLGVNYEPSELEKQYQEGSTQIPAKAQVLINDRFQRKVSCNGQILIIDRV